MDKIYNIQNTFNSFFRDVRLNATVRTVLCLLEISSFNNIFRQILQACDDDDCLFANLNLKNFGLTLFFLQEKCYSEVFEI